MAASGDVQVAQDGGLSNIKLHPYLIALIRWCVSSVWSTATLVLHRFMVSPQPLVSAQKPPKRPPSTDHLHPEPRVQCEVLHAPACPTVDIVFVHGLYGSLANTWRQGEWKTKYNSQLTIQPLRRNSIPTSDDATTQRPQFDTDNRKEGESEEKDSSHEQEKEFDNMFKSDSSNFDSDERRFYDDIRKILPKENAFITEKFYNNTLLDQVDVTNNYETQASFVSDLFTRHADDSAGASTGASALASCDCPSDRCETGCGCACERCYSPCWPRDWLSVDQPGARVISVNYTSDPYLWRPLWVKESKRQRLPERAEQMTEQLLALGVGQRPVVWVGHSKGGLFIKQIYCEAYEAYLKLQKGEGTEDQIATDDNRDGVNGSECNNDNMFNHNLEYTDIDNLKHADSITNNKDEEIDVINDKMNKDMYNECVYIENSIKEAFHFNDKYFDEPKTEEGIDDSRINDQTNLNMDNECYLENRLKEAFHFNDKLTNNNEDGTQINDQNNDVDNDCIYIKDSNIKEAFLLKQCDVESNLNTDKVNVDYKRQLFKNVYIERRAGHKEDVVNNSNKDDGGAFKDGNEDGDSLDDVNCNFQTAEESDEDAETPSDDDGVSLRVRAALWARSAGFMFYSVPHRGSPLADIKTPITARSVELMEICKDCELVRGLQARWRRAALPRPPAVRSLVETNRTLMSLLWLRIVSVDSADPGIGSLSGVNVDHRDICKPTGRACPLYRELMRLVDSALDGSHREDVV